MSDSVRPHRRQPTRLPHPWDSPGKNTGVGCHFLLQCMKVKSESEVAQLCPTLHDSMDCSLQGSSIHGIFQARVLEWVPIAFSLAPWPAYRFLKRQVRWSDIPIFLRIFHSLLWSTQSKTLGTPWSRSRCFSGTLLLFWWSNWCWQFDLWFLCLF